MAGWTFFVVNGFIEALKANEPVPIDVFDSAAWSVITPLSEQSVAAGELFSNFLILQKENGNQNKICLPLVINIKSLFRFNAGKNPHFKHQ